MIRWSDDNGMSLLSATWVVFLLSILAVGVLSVTLTFRKTVSTLEAGVQDRFDAASALDLFIHQQFYDPIVKAYFEGVVVLTGEEFFVFVEHESGKINLNRASEPLLSALFAVSGQDHEKSKKLAAAIVDWRDRDDESLGLGAESAEYAAAGLSYGPRNGPFETVGELAGVLGVDFKTFQCVAPFLTVYSLEGEVDLSVAPAAVEKILTWAFDNDWESVDWPVIVPQGSAGSLRPDSDLGGHSFVFRVSRSVDGSQGYRQVLRFKSLADKGFDALSAFVPFSVSGGDAGCLL